MLRLELVHDPAVGELRLRLERSGEVTEAVVEFGYSVGHDDLEALRWVLEDHGDDAWQGAHSDDYATHARETAADIGLSLFEAAFGGRSAAPIREAVLEKLSDIDVEIRTEGAASSTMPWELMTEPVRSRPIALHARSFSRVIAAGSETYSEPASCRVLIVISRPDLTDDVPMTSVASQIVRAAMAAGLPLSIEVARPPTFDSVESLLRRAAGIGLPYSAVHFDGHGVFSTEEDLLRRGLSIRPEQHDRPASAKRGFLIFEGPDGSAEAVSGRSLGSVCYDNGVRCVVLNACQSATEMAAGGSAGVPSVDGAPQESRAYGSLADELLRCGMAGVVAMRYAVRVEAAASIMRALYDMLFAGMDLALACTAARRAVSREGEPMKELDWLVPTVHLRPDVQAIINPGRQESGAAVAPAFDALPAADTVLLQLDRAFDHSQVAFLTGWPGTGKSSLASAFAFWYAMTGGCQRGVSHLQVTDDIDAADVARLLTTVRDVRATFEFHGSDPEAEAVLTRFGQQVASLPALVIVDQLELISFMHTAQRTEILALLRDHDDPSVKVLAVSCRDDAEFLGGATQEIPQIFAGSLSEASATRLAQESAARAGRDLSDEEAEFLVTAADGIPALLTSWSAISPSPAPAKWWLVPAAAYPPDAEARTARYFTRVLAECLTPDDRAVLSMLYFFHRRASADAVSALLFGEDVLSGTGIQGVVSTTVQDAFSKAVQFGLLVQEAPITYRIHPCLPQALADARNEMLRAASQQDSPVSEADIAARWLQITARLANEIRDIVEEGYHHALVRLDLEMDNILAAFKEAKRRADWVLIIQLLQGLRMVSLSQSRLEWWSELLDGLEDSYRSARDQPQWREELVHYLSYKAELSMIRDDPREALSTYGEMLGRLSAEAAPLFDRTGLTDREMATVRMYGVVEEKTAQILSQHRDATCFTHFEAAQRAYQHIDDGQAQAVLSLLRAEAHRVFDEPDEALQWLDRALSRLNPYDRSRRASAWLMRGMAVADRIPAHAADTADDASAVDRLLDEASAAFVNSAREAPTERGIAEAERRLAGLLNKWERSPDDAAASALRSLGYYAKAEPRSVAHLDCLLQAGIALRRIQRAGQAAIHLRTLIDIAIPEGESAQFYQIAERLLREIDGGATPTDNADMLLVSQLVERLRTRLDGMDDNLGAILDPQAKAEADELLERLAPPITSPTFVDALQAVGFLFQMRSQSRPEFEKEQPVAFALFAILNALAPHKVPEEIRRHLARRSSDLHPAVLAAALATEMANDASRAEDLGWLNTTLGLLHTATTAFPRGEPSLGMYLFNLGNTWRTRYLRLRRPTDLDQAIEVGRQAVQLTPHDHPNLVGRLTNLAVALLMRIDLAGNNEDLSEVAKIQQRIAGMRSEVDAGVAASQAIDAITLYETGQRIEHDGDADAAIPWYQRAAEQGVSRAMTRLGVIYYGKGHRARAEAWLEQAAEQSDTYAMYMLGGFAEDQGDREGAERWWRRAAELDDANAMAVLGSILARQGDTTDAETFLRRGSEMGHPICMKELARLLRAQGNRREARLWKARAKEATRRLGPPRGVI